MQWWHLSSHRPKKFKEECSVKKMANVFWDKRSVFLVKFWDRETTVIADSYYKTLRYLRRAIVSKRHEMLFRRILFLHDNVWPHTANLTMTALKQISWEIINNPPSSLDIALSDKFLFLHLKLWLASQRYADE